MTTSEQPSLRGTASRAIFDSSAARFLLRGPRALLELRRDNPLVDLHKPWRLGKFAMARFLVCILLTFVLGIYLMADFSPAPRVYGSYKLKLKKNNLDLTIKNYHMFFISTLLIGFSIFGSDPSNGCRITQYDELRSTLISSPRIFFSKIYWRYVIYLFLCFPFLIMHFINFYINRHRGLFEFYPRDGIFVNLIVPFIFYIEFGFMLICAREIIDNSSRLIIFLAFFLIPLIFILFLIFSYFVFIIAFTLFGYLFFLPFLIYFLYTFSIIFYCAVVCFAHFEDLRLHGQPRDAP